MVRKVLTYKVLAIVLCYSIPVEGQAVYGVREAATLAISATTARDTNAVAIIEQAKREVSLVDKIEFRTETNRWDTERQEYLVRTSFKSKAEKRATVDLYGSYLTMWEAEAAADRSEVVKDVYMQMTRISYLQQQLSFVQERILIQEDVLKLKRYEAITEGTATPLAVLKAEDELLDLQTEKDGIREELRLEKEQLQIGEDNEWQLEAGLWPSAEEMLATVERTVQEAALPSDLMAQIAEVKQRELLLSREVAQGEKVLDFMQLKYTGRDGQGFGNQLALGLGIVLPTGHLNRDGISEATVKLHTEQRKEDRLAAEIQKEVSLSRTAFLVEFESFQNYKRRVQQQDLPGKLAKYEAIVDRDIEVVLTLKEMLIKQQKELQQRIAEVRKAYVKVLFSAGVLTSAEALWPNVE